MSNDNYNAHSIDAVIARIDENLRTIIRTQQEIHEKHDDLLERVGKLEQWRWYLIGVFMVGGIGGGVSADFLGKLIKAAT